VDTGIWQVSLNRVIDIRNSWCERNRTLILPSYHISTQLRLRNRLHLSISPRTRNIQRSHDALRLELPRSPRPHPGRRAACTLVSVQGPPPCTTRRLLHCADRDILLFSRVYVGHSSRGNFSANAFLVLFTTQSPLPIGPSHLLFLDAV
jgi:hypothetical protein